MNGKNCNVCGKWFEQDQFTYGNRDNNSYCKACAKEYGEHYTKGGTVATRKWLDDMRTKWK